MSTINRRIRAQRRELARWQRLYANRKDMVTIAEYYTKTERLRYILHDDGTRTLLDVEPYWHGEPPFTVMHLHGIPEWMSVPTYQNNGISREGFNA